MIVILDNGHGNDTPGKRSPIWNDGSQLFEWEFNRELTSLIKSGLEKDGIKSFILVHEKKDILLRERVKRANEIYKVNNRKAFLVSVHANAGHGEGWEIFTSIGQTDSDKLATYIFSEAHKLLPDIRKRTDVSDGDPDKEENFFLLKETKCPAVLTENLFMDNEQECKFLMTEMGKQLLADIHINGIKKYIQSL